MKHLRLDYQTAYYKCGEKLHAQEIMKSLGIKYQHSTPQTILDGWWFWNCENVPEKLPKYLKELNADPMKYIGWGLNQKTAESIRDYK